MSLYASMTTAISGMTAQSSRLGHISDNVANSSTIGYKRLSTNFSTLVTVSNARTHSPGGVISSPQRNVSLQGSIEASRINTNLAVSGKGMFIVSNVSGTEDTIGLNEKQLYTRTGDFRIDADGNFVNSSGYFLQGWQYADDGASLPNRVLKTVNVANITGIAEPTRNVTYGANVPAGQVEIAAAPGAGQATYFTEQVWYDDLGVGHTVRTEFYPAYDGQFAAADGTMDPTNTWNMRMIELAPGSDPNIAANWQVVGTSSATFNDGTVANQPAGTLDKTGVPTEPAVPVADTLYYDADSGELYFYVDPVGAGASAPAWALQDMTRVTVGRADANVGMTQFSDDFAIVAVRQDGLRYGQFDDVFIDESGDVWGQFGNGTARKLFKVPLAVFSNPDGLQLVDGNAYRASGSSGDASILEAEVGRAGTIVSEATEASNVDIAEEFTQMIQAQRAYSANSRVITTADDMTQEILNIKR